MFDLAFTFADCGGDSSSESEDDADGAASASQLGREQTPLEFAPSIRIFRLFLRLPFFLLSVIVAM